MRIYINKDKYLDMFVADTFILDFEPEEELFVAIKARMEGKKTIDIEIEEGSVIEKLPVFSPSDFKGLDTKSQWNRSLLDFLIKTGNEVAVNGDQ